MPLSELQRVAIAGSGFLADAYDLYVIGQVQDIIFSHYSIPEKDQKSLKGVITSTALVGAITGQLVFGALADRLGRKRIFLITALTIVAGALLSASAQEGLFSGVGRHQIVYQIAAGRFILGVGIGGEYPLSATIASESCSAGRRGFLMACVFAQQGVGYLLSSTVMLTCVALHLPDEFIWRFALGFGAFVPMVSFYFRLKMEESESFNEVSRARAAGEEAVSTSATVWRYRWHILGTALNWAIFDVVFYANSLFNSDVTKKLHVGDGRLGVMLRTFIIVLIQLPGYIAAVLTINRLGRKNMQLLGYSMMCVLFLLISLTYEDLIVYPALFVFVYGMTFFFSDFGPNTTTYVIPGEIFPAQIKATSHGLSAAAGKAGATIGSSCFELLQPSTSAGLKNAMLICSAFALAGVIITVVLTPRYDGEDLDRKRPGETVGFVPLSCQKGAREACVSEASPAHLEAHLVR